MENRQVDRGSGGATIGYVVGGGLKEGLRVRLTAPVQDLQEGSFVVCDSGRWRFYGLVTDLRLGATDPRFASDSADRFPPALRDLLYGQTLYATLEVFPTLMLDRGPEDPLERLAWEAEIEAGRAPRPRPRPVKTIPGHHAPVRLAHEGDIAEVFGREAPDRFVVGYTLEQGYPVRLDLGRFVKRSSGIFGATGTGKSFLTRLLLAGIIAAGVDDPTMASVLVFDMHNEYGFDDTDEEDNLVRGLKSLFGPRVQVAALGAGSQVRGQSPDFTLEIAMSDITPGDIMALSESLDLTETAPTTLHALWRSFGERWFERFTALEAGKTITTEEGKTVPAPDSVAAWARENNIHEGAAEALHRKLRPIADQNYVVPRPAADAVTAIVDRLEQGRHVVLSFGRHESELDYLLVSNILTRRIRERWVEKSETYRSQRALGARPPKPLLIVVEEAHKLLSPRLAGQTAFGQIAREMRKYYVTLLIVDQRPSAIHDEVMSQLGTRITGWLGDANDIAAVLTGLSGRDKLRGMLARLQEREEVLLLGWGVPMPIAVRSRRYDRDFWEEIQARVGVPVAAERPTLDQLNEELFG